VSHEGLVSSNQRSPLNSCEWKTTTRIKKMHPKQITILKNSTSHLLPDSPGYTTTKNISAQLKKQKQSTLIGCDIIVNYASLTSRVYFPNHGFVLINTN
jgi:hypothetical protein